MNELNFIDVIELLHFVISDLTIRAGKPTVIHLLHRLRSSDPVECQKICWCQIPRSSDMNLRLRANKSLADVCQDLKLSFFITAAIELKWLGTGKLLILFVRVKMS